MQKNKEKDIKRRQKTYHCNGICYGNTFMCPQVETCPETRKKEFFCTVAAVLLLLGLGLLVVTGLIYVAYEVLKIILHMLVGVFGV